MTVNTTPTRRAFTLIELLVVVVTITIVLGIAVPTFSAQLTSIKRSLAENSVQTAVTVARDLAMRDPGGDAAAVFFFDPETGTRIVPMVQINSGEFLEQDPAGSGDPVARDVFAPLAGARATTMPAFLNVRGLVTRASFGPSGVNRPDQWALEQWYGLSHPVGETREVRQWVLPETGFYELDTAFDGPERSARSTFMVRFERGTGRLMSQSRDAIVLDPRPSFENRPQVSRRGSDAWKRVDRSADLAAWARDVLSRPDSDFANADERFELIGSISNDTALARPVTRLALYDERRLANDLGARNLNRSTRSLYQPFDDWNPGTAFDRTLFRGTGPRPSDAQLVQRITRWIEGDTNYDGELGFAADGRNPDEPEATMFAVPAYGGDLQEIVQ